MKRKPTSSNRTLSNRVKSQSHSKKGNSNQSASGVLKGSCKAENLPFEKSIEPLDLDNIQHFAGIPDFIEPTRSPYPIIVQSPLSKQCIDGWELIEQAKHRGETALNCEIIHIQQDSEIEFALWKASVRTMPIGGTCIYPENMGNACRLFTILREFSENHMVFSHGGARRGDSYPNCPENNIRLVLADRLGKSVSTINKYLQHGKNLSQEALQTLISAGVQKGFFEAIQKDKQRLIDDLKAEQKSHDEIVNAVSARVLSRLEQFQSSDPVEVVFTQIEQHDRPATEIQSQPNDIPSSSVTPIEHKHWSGNPSAAFEEPPTEDGINQEYKAIGQLLIETAENKKLSTQDRLQIFSDLIIRQSRLIQHLNHLLPPQIINGEELR